MPKMGKTTPSTDLLPIPEVIDFVEADAAYKEFLDRNRKLINELRLLAADRNAKLEAADKALRILEISAGPWKMLGPVTVRVKSEELVEQIGLENFKSLGGRAETRTEYVIDRADFERAASSGAIPADVVQVVTTRVCRFHKPEEVVLP